MVLKIFLNYILKTLGLQNFYLKLSFFFKFENQKFILISKNLNDFFKLKKKDYIILDDASDPMILILKTNPQKTILVFLLEVFLREKD